MHAHRFATLTLVICVAACGNTSQPGSSPSGSTPTDGGNATDSGALAALTPAFSHTFDPVVVDASQEIVGLCQSWTLNNDAPFYVNTIVEKNGGKFHHSNWIWVPDTMYTGADGTWNCSDRSFDEVAAGASGGVFFAQSTQALSDTQGFPPGTAFQVPAHARIIGDVHLLNTSEDDATTSLHLDVYTIPQSSVITTLQPMAFTNLALDIPPGMQTQARMQCATPQPNFNVYYILPHFHSYGQEFVIDVAGGPMDGTSILDSKGTIGNSVGQTFSPPIAITGASGLAITCDYQNPTSQTLVYGNGSEEMCVALLYTDGEKAGGEAISNLTTTDSGGVHSTDGLCVSVGSP